MKKIWLLRIIGWGTVFGVLGHFAWYYDVDYYAKNYELIPLFFDAKLGDYRAQLDLGLLHRVETIVRDEADPEFCPRYRHSLYWYRLGIKKMSREVSEEQVGEYLENIEYEKFTQDYYTRCGRWK